MKAHLALSPEPIPSGFDRAALCGRIVKAAEFVPLTEETEEPSSLKGLCQTCKEKAYMEGLHFEMGMVDGEELKAREG